MPEFNNLRNRVAVVGVGTTAYGSFPEMDEYGLAAEAFRNALGNQLDPGTVVPCLKRGHRLVAKLARRGVREKPFRSRARFD